MIVFVFLCGFNVALAYFTAQASVSGDLSFYDLNVTFAYREQGSNLQNSTGTSVYTLTPTSSSILRGVEFGFKTTSGTQIKDIGLLSSGASCRSCARIKVTAVKQQQASNGAYTADADTTDYGEYIKLSTSLLEKEEDGYYYLYEVMSAGSYYSLITGATLSIDAPIELTDSYLKITISFEAVQATYDAVAEKFGADIAENINFDIDE